MNKKGFTLVELIVVVTIITILATIGIISFQGYSSIARDSSRSLALGDMQKILELSKTKNGIYPDPTGGIEITYTGGQVWTQGTFGKEISKDLEGIEKREFKDPLTEIDYTYSRLNNTTEYELAGIYEGDEITSVLNNDTYAATETTKAVVVGDYNKQVASVKKGTKTFILAVPTIINGDIDLTRIEDIIAYKKLIYNGFKNLPANYKDNGKYNPVGEPDLNLVNENNLVVFSGSVNELKDENTQIKFIENLQKAYSTTDITDENKINKILNYDTTTDTESAKYIAQTIINKNVSSKVKITVEEPIEKAVFVATPEQNQAFNDVLLSVCGISQATIDANFNIPTGVYTGNISCNNKGITDSDLANFLPLREVHGSLELYNNDISTLVGLSNLTRTDGVIYLFDNQLTNLNGLQNLKIAGGNFGNPTVNRGLWIGTNDITDISAISDIEQLEMISFRYMRTPITNGITSVLEGIKTLEYIRFNGASITNIDFVINLPNLIGLDVGDTDINDSSLNILSTLTNLKFLRISRNGITSISPLANLINMSELAIEVNAITDLSPVENMTNLKYLIANNNNISDISYIHSMNGLQRLFLNNNNISDISVMSNHKSTPFWYLSIYGNPLIQDLSPLNDYTSNSIRDFYITDRTYTTKINSSSTICTDWDLHTYSPSSYDITDKSNICNP